MLRRLLLPGLLLFLAFSTARLAGQEPQVQEPPPSPQPYSIPMVEMPSLPQRVSGETVNTIPTAPMVDPEANTPAEQVVPVGLATPNSDADLLRAIGRLRQELDGLVRERQELEMRSPKLDSPGSLELSLLRQRLLALHKRLEQPMPSLPPVTNPPQSTVPVPPSEGNTKGPAVPATMPNGRLPGDPYLLAQAHFRAGQYQEALTVYRGQQLDLLSQDERLLVQYLSACCLRKLGKLDEAIALYREVADAREDEFLAECSLWHLNNIGWRKEVEKQLASIRAARQAP
jgi:tetratricopeptide (TPR) repeat protein